MLRKHTKLTDMAHAHWHINGACPLAMFMEPCPSLPFPTGFAQTLSLSSGARSIWCVRQVTSLQIHHVATSRVKPQQTEAAHGMEPKPLFHTNPRN